MPTWIHCNICYRFYSRKHQFFMLNCSHILCQGCLQKEVIEGNNECKFCKKSVRFRKICKELDINLRRHFELNQSKYLVDLSKSLNIAQLQFKHLTNPAVLSKIQKKTEDMQEFDKKLVMKIAKMKRYLASVNKTQSSHSSGSSHNRGGSNSSGSQFSGSHGGHLASTSAIRKEPLLMMPSSGSNGRSFSHSSLSSFLPASILSHAGRAQQPNPPQRMQPHITRLSKLSLESTNRRH